MLLVITQKGTIEGYTAGWVAKRSMKGECEWVQIGEGDKLPDMTDREVYFFGVSISRNLLESLRRKAKSIRIFDNDFRMKVQIGGLKDVKINIKHTAARMAWEFLRADFKVRVGKNKENEVHYQSAPWIVDYSDSMELWRWPAVNQNFVKSAIESLYSQTLESWDELSTRALEIVEGQGEEISKNPIKQLEEKGEQNEIHERQTRRKSGKSA